MNAVATIPEPEELERRYVKERLAAVAAERERLEAEEHELVARAIALGVPIAQLAVIAGVTRKTIYRWVGIRY